MTQICPKDPDFSSDASRITLTVLGTFLACFLFTKAFWYVKSYGWACEMNRKHVAARASKLLTLVATLAGIVSVVFAILADGHNNSLQASTPLLSWDWLVFHQWVVLLLSLYFSGVLLLKAHCFRLFQNKMMIASLKEPQIMMQILTLIPAFISVIFKNELMPANSKRMIDQLIQTNNSGQMDALMRANNYGLINGMASLSIAMATGVVVIQVGNAGVTSFGNFATMFHLTLKKIPSHVFAIVYLFHGFSFGFWMLENRLTTANDEQDFTDYWKSFISVFSMAFGLAEFNFDGPFKYSDMEFVSGEHVNIVFAYILICLMVLLVLLGLLNLLLSSIIKDHKEMQAEVAVNNIVFMAQYAVWTDFWTGLWCKCCPVNVAKWVDIKSNKKVKYCRAPFCAKSVKSEEQIRKRSSSKSNSDKRKSRSRFYGNGLQNEETSQNGHFDIADDGSSWRHIEPQFDWVLDKLYQKPEKVEDAELEWVVEQLRENVAKEKKEWEKSKGGDEQKRPRICVVNTYDRQVSTPLLFQH